MLKWTVKAEAKAQASCADVWEIWTDVPSWPKWDRELEWSSLDGPFIPGTKGKLKPRGWPTTKFHLSWVEKDKSYSDETQMPLTKVTFSHHVHRVETTTILIQHHVTVCGLLAPLLFFALRPKLLKGLNLAVGTLAQLAEAKSKMRANV
jgi:hypothetical protein